MDSSRVRVAVAIVRLLFAATLLGLIRALYMEPCPLEAEEGTTELSTACIGIAPQDQVKWWYTSPSKGSNPISLGTCYPTQEPCVLKVGRFFNITRPRKDMSVLTIKNVNRDHHAGARVTCRTYYLSSLADSTSCRMKVISPTSASWRNDATLAASIAVPIVVLVIVIAVVAFIVIRRRRSQHVCERRKKSVVYQAEYRHEAVQTGPSDGISTIRSIANGSDSSDYCSPDGSTTYPKQPVSLRGNDNNAFESDVQPEQTSHSAPKRDNLYPDQGASTA